LVEQVNVQLVYINLIGGLLLYFPSMLRRR